MVERPRLEARQRTERPHVLIVCDEPELITFLEQGLPLGGFWTSTIASGIQALEVFRLRQFDLVLVDMQMTSFDAVEFLLRLRGRSTRDSSPRPRTGAPVVVITETEPGWTDAVKAACQVYATLLAPFELEDIVQILHAGFADWRSAHPDDQLADARATRSD